MTLGELKALQEQLERELFRCGDIEYRLINNMRSAVAEYIEAIEHVGEDAVSTKRVTRSWEIDARWDAQQS